MGRLTFSLPFPDLKGRPPPGRLQTSLQAQLGRLYTTRRHRVTFLHWCVHSMAPNPNSEPSQPPSSFTVALHHGFSKLPRLISQHCLRASKCHALLSARVRQLSEFLRPPFPFLLDFDLRETFFRRPSSRVLFFGRLPSQPSNFSLSVYLCYVPTVVYGYSLLWERIVLCFRGVSVSMWYLLLHVFL